jgi:hemerythrin superfamily protein
MKATKSSKSKKSDDIISLILKDHEPIKKLLLILKDPDATLAKKRPAYAKFESVLSNHAKAEEESLYVHMKKEEDLRVEGLEGDTEHALADLLMKQISEIKNDDDTWMAKVKVLAEVVDHHVKEEEKEVLKQVRKDFDQDERIEIGIEYSQLLEEMENQNPNKKRAQSSSLEAAHV